MDFYGHINLLNNEIQQAVMQSEVNFPVAEATPGRLIFKDKRVFICTEIDGSLPIWVPLTNEINTYMHTQASGSTTWTITHNLNTTLPLVQVYDSAHKQFIPDEVEVISNNVVQVTLASAITGRAIVMHGDISGGDVSETAYEHNQTSGSTSWVVNHNLGYKPLVRVFVGGQEIQPQSIVVDNFTATITFSSAQTGYATFV